MTIKLFQFLKCHRTIGYVGGIAVFLFALSGILHPLVSWTGPQAVQHRPATALFNQHDLHQMSEIMRNNGLNEVEQIKIVPGPEGKLLQVTATQFSPRRYFDLGTGQELVDYEERYAIWLARYYTESKAPVAKVSFKTTFDNSYTWVNRLLPVYQIHFDDEDKTSVFIDTELGALAGITNDYKNTLQTLFRWIHTWSFIGEENPIRFTVVFLLATSVVVMTLTGTVLIFKFKRRTPTMMQRMHRYIGMAVFIFLGFFSLSGTYHLVLNELENRSQTMVKAKTFALPTTVSAPESIESELTSVTLIKADELMFRLATKPTIGNGSRDARFKGMASEGKPIYVNAITGETIDLEEETLARYYARIHRPDNTIKSIEKITRFGNGYDFRNKRLPVWQVTLDSGLIIFIDNASGYLVDQLTPSAALEQFSFSMLHKFNFLTPLMGRFNRDVVMVTALIFAMIMTGMGYVLLLRKPR